MWESDILINAQMKKFLIELKKREHGEKVEKSRAQIIEHMLRQGGLID